MTLRFPVLRDLLQIAANPRMSPLILGLVILTTCSSCSGSKNISFAARHSITTAPAVPAAPVHFFAPTKDDVLWVDGRRLSISGYHALRENLPSTLTHEQVLWIATAALALQNDALPKGTQIPLKVAVQKAMIALEDSTTKRELEKIIAQATVQRNPLVLAELR